jgi:hypothetical protein
MYVLRHSDKADFTPFLLSTKDFSVSLLERAVGQDFPPRIWGI